MPICVICRLATLYFGVEDGTHDIIGTSLYGKQKMVGNEDLESWLSTRLNSRIDFEIVDDFDYEDNGHVCIFKIPATVNRPVSFLHEAYVRVGTITRKLKDFPAKEAKIWKGEQKALEKIVLKKGLSPQGSFTFECRNILRHDAPSTASRYKRHYGKIRFREAHSKG